MSPRVPTKMFWLRENKIDFQLHTLEACNIHGDTLYTTDCVFVLVEFALKIKLISITHS